jgi:hypothetical protein
MAPPKAQKVHEMMKELDDQLEHINEGITKTLLARRIVIEEYNRKLFTACLLQGLLHELDWSMDGWGHYGALIKGNMDYIRFHLDPEIETNSDGLSAKIAVKLNRPKFEFEGVYVSFLGDYNCILLDGDTKNLEKFIQKYKLPMHGLRNWEVLDRTIGDKSTDLEA